MIIKQSEHRDADITELNTLLATAHIGTAVKNKIEREIRNIRSGMAGEKEAAYNIDFHYADSKNWMVIHDLRLEHQGQSAQIDHLLINRFMEIYVCESKRFGEGIAINEHGEFSAYYQGKPHGIPSPIEQNERHIKLLNKLCNDGAIELPLRLGLKIKPKFYSLILIANGARISRPKNGKAVQGLDRIIKNEQVFKKIHKDIGDENLLTSVTSVTKIVSQETLQNFAQALAGLHQPLQMDWKARFGIPDSHPPCEDKPAEQTHNAETNLHADTHNNSAQQSNRLFCAACRKTVSLNVAKFCWNNKNRFQNKVYCYDCQRNMPSEALS